MIDQKTHMTVTITGIPISLNGQVALADAVVAVDFAAIAAECVGSAAFTLKKTATRMRGAIVVKATNVRPRK